MVDLRIVYPPIGGDTDESRLAPVRDSAKGSGAVAKRVNQGVLRVIGGA